MNSILVAYFSATGVTAKAASQLSKVLNADLHEIKPAAPYTKADLNWMDQKSRSTLEMKDPNSRPEIAPESRVENMHGYKTVFLGFPIWWYTAPSIIRTFLEQYDFSGKTIILFATSGGSGFGQTAKDLQSSVSPQTAVKEGRLLNGRLSAEALKSWTEELGI
ncbi:NAD(P)H-dependent oxidoreductase [bacterium]|nr:NAD(P)H-dependent oxidoreductase [bacterium]